VNVNRGAVGGGKKKGGIEEWKRRGKGGPKGGEVRGEKGWVEEGGDGGRERERRREK